MIKEDILCKWKVAGVKTGVAIFIANKIDCTTKAIVRDRKEHDIMIKGTIQQQDITTVHTCEPNIGEPKYIKQALMDIKGETDSNIDILEDFNTH